MISSYIALFVKIYFMREKSLMGAGDSCQRLKKLNFHFMQFFCTHLLQFIPYYSLSLL